MIDLYWNKFDPENMPSTWNTTSRPFNNFIFIIIPSYIKMYEDMALRMLWLNAHKSISEASEIYIVGYSFPKADILSRQLLLHASDSIKRIIVIGPLSEGCKEIDKKEYIFSMFPWKEDHKHFFDKIEIETRTLNQYLYC